MRRVCLLHSLEQLKKAFRCIQLKLNAEIIRSNSRSRSLRQWFSLFTGNRAAEERRETMGQKVQVDEHEGGVRSPVLSGLDESVCPAGSREGQSLPVRGLRRPTRHVTCSVSTQTSLFAFNSVCSERPHHAALVASLRSWKHWRSDGEWNWCPEHCYNQSRTVNTRLPMMFVMNWIESGEILEALTMELINHHQPWQITEVFLFSWLTDAFTFAG